MDMLLIGNGCITEEEERTQMAIWSISASPLIMGNDLRKVPAKSQAILLNKDAIAVNQDRLGKMGIRHPRFRSSSSAQLWYRELSDGHVAVALYNKATSQHPPIPGAPCDTWNRTDGGYLEACGGAGGNIDCFAGLTEAQALEGCCQNTQCAGFSFEAEGGSGCYKKNQDCGKVGNSNYIGYTKPSQMPTPSGQTADITVNFADVGLSAKDAVDVYDIWAQKGLGSFTGSFTAKGVLAHDTAFLRLSRSAHVALVV